MPGADYPARLAGGSPARPSDGTGPRYGPHRRSDTRAIRRGAPKDRGRDRRRRPGLSPGRRIRGADCRDPGVRHPPGGMTHLDTDILIVGAGGAGMYAAIAAARAGAERVLLADKSLVGRGGATIMAQ